MPLTITVRAIGLRSTEFIGAPYAIKAAAEAVGAPIMRSHLGRGYLVPQADADDVLARLEELGHHIEVTL